MWHTNALKTHQPQSRISKKFRGLYPRTPASGGGEGRKGEDRTGGEGEGRRVGPPTFETVPPPLIKCE